MEVYSAVLSVEWKFLVSLDLRLRDVVVHSLLRAISEREVECLSSDGIRLLQSETRVSKREVLYALRASCGGTVKVLIC